MSFPNPRRLLLACGFYRAGLLLGPAKFWVGSAPVWANLARGPSVSFHIPIPVAPSRAGMSAGRTCAEDARRPVLSCNPQKGL